MIITCFLSFSDKYAYSDRCGAHRVRFVEFHVLTVEHGWVVGNGEGVDTGDYMCEQSGLVLFFLVRRRCRFWGRGEKRSPIKI